MWCSTSSRTRSTDSDASGVNTANFTQTINQTAIANTTKGGQ